MPNLPERRRADGTGEIVVGHAVPNWAGGSHDGDEGPPAPLSLRDVLAALRRHTALVLASALVVTALAAWYGMTRPPSYTAKAAIRLIDRQSAITGGLGGGAGRPASGAVDPILSQLAVLRSRTVGGKVVDNLPALRLAPEGFPAALLADVSITGEDIPDSLIFLFSDQGVTTTGPAGAMTVPYGTPIQAGGLSLVVTARPRDDEGVLHVRSRDRAINFLLSSLEVVPRPETDVVDVSYTADHAAAARDVVNSIVETFQAANLEASQAESRLRREFLEGQLAGIDSVVEAARSALTAFQRSHGSPSAAPGVGAGVGATQGDLAAKREELEAQRRLFRSVEEATTNASAGARSAAIRAAMADPAMSSYQSISQLYGQVLAYERTRDSLTTGRWALAPTHPDVTRLSGLIASTEGRIVAAVQNVARSLDGRIASIEDLQRRGSAAAATRTSVQATSRATEAVLAEELASARSVADQLRMEYERARIAEAVEVGQVSVLDWAALPGPSSGLPLSRLLPVALVLGLGLGVALSLLAERLNTSIRSHNQVAGELHVPGLIVIPKGRGEPRSLRRLRRLAPAPSNSNGTSAHPPIVMAEAPGSAGAESYRALRTKLLFSRNADDLKSIAVTSPTPGDGKTTIAANLAVSFAEQGLRTVIVDCDLRRPRMHRIFDGPAEPGLAGVLSGSCELADALRGTGVDCLELVPSGGAHEATSELLGTGRMRSVLAELRQEYDMVIVDTPPVLSAADAMLVGALVDGVIMVVRAAETSRDVARHALQQLADVRASVIGVVLNDAHARLPAHGMGYYYGSYVQQS